jgi:hypothetical protein
MSLDPASIIVSLLLSSVGFVGFVYGKRQSRLPHMLAGAVLMIFPYFVPNVWWMAGVGVAIISLWILAVRSGA